MQVFEHQSPTQNPFPKSTHNTTICFLRITSQPSNYTPDFLILYACNLWTNSHHTNKSHLTPGSSSSLASLRIPSPGGRTQRALEPPFSQPPPLDHPFLSFSFDCHHCYCHFSSLTSLPLPPKEGTISAGVSLGRVQSREPTAHRLVI